MLIAAVLFCVAGTGEHSSVDAPMAVEAGTAEPLLAGLPLVGQPVVGLPVVGQPVVGLPVVGQPVAGLPAAGLESAVVQPAAEESPCDSDKVAVNPANNGFSIRSISGNSKFRSEHRREGSASSSASF